MEEYVTSRSEFRRPIVSMKESINLHCSRLPERDSHVGVCVQISNQGTYSMLCLGLVIAGVYSPFT